VLERERKSRSISAHHQSAGFNVKNLVVV